MVYIITLQAYMYLKIAHIFTEKIKLHLNPVTGEALDDYCETIEGFWVAHSTKLASLLALVIILYKIPFDLTYEVRELCGL